MEATARAVEILTEPHRMLAEQQDDNDPLITQLKEARYPSLGRTKAGAGSGSPIDHKAIALYEYIDGTVRAWLNYYRHSDKGELIDLIKELHQVILTEDAGDRLDNRERMFWLFPNMVTQIEEYFDPPSEHELMEPCPECGTAYIFDGEGREEDQERSHAVRVRLKRGHALQAECHACRKLWVGETELTRLAALMGASIDWDMIKLLLGDTPLMVEGVQK